MGGGRVIDPGPISKQIIQTGNFMIRVGGGGRFSNALVVPRATGGTWYSTFAAGDCDSPTGVRCACPGPSPIPGPHVPLEGVDAWLRFPPIVLHKEGRAASLGQSGVGSWNLL